MSTTVQSGLDRWLNDGVPAADCIVEDTADAITIADTHLDASALASADELSSRLVLPYTPFPRQQEFHRSPAKYRLFGGAAGPGKSKALLIDVYKRQALHAAVN